MLSGPVSDWIARAPSIFSDLQAKMRALRGVAATVAEVGNQVDNITKGATGPQVPEVVVKQPGIAASLAWVAPLFLAQIVFVLVLLFFLLSSGDMIYEKIVHVLPTLTDKKRAMRIAHDIEQKLSTYLFTITMINIGLGIVIGTVMWAIGMPNPLLFGVGVFALNYIPYAGPATGVALATVVGLISGDGLWMGAAGGRFLHPDRDDRRPSDNALFRRPSAAAQYGGRVSVDRALGMDVVGGRDDRGDPAACRYPHFLRIHPVARGRRRVPVRARRRAGGDQRPQSDLTGPM